MNKKLGFSILSILVATIMLAGLTLPVGAKLGRTIFSNIVNNTATTMDDVSDLEVVDDVDEVDDDVNEYELTGAVEVISAESWIIGGVTFQVTAETEIEDLIAVGDIVKVDAFSDGQGGYIASEIELVDDDVDDIDDVDEDENEIEMTGTVEAISAESWTIGGVTFLVTADTEIEDLIALGDNVKVEAISDGQGGYIASEIELVDDDDMEDTYLDDDDDSDTNDDDDSDTDDDDGSDDEDDSGSDDGDDVEEDD